MSEITVYTDTGVKTAVRPVQKLKYIYMGPGPAELALYCRQMASLLEAGVPVLNCLKVLEKDQKNKQLSVASRRISEHLQEGNTLLDSVKKCPGVFPGIFVSLIRVGEESGSLVNSFERLETYFEKENEIKENLKSAAVYPLIVLLISIVLLFLVVKLLLPSLTGMLMQYGAELPLLTRVVVYCSNFISTYWYAGVISAAVFFMVFVWSMQVKRCRYILDNIMLNIPVFGELFKVAIISRFCQVFSILLQCGIPVLQVLELCRDTVSNSVVAGAINDTEKRIKRGSGIAESMSAVGIFPSLLLQMVRTGEESGSLDKLSEKMAIFYEKEVNNSINRLTRMVEPLLIICVGVVAGVVVLSVFLPLMNLLGGM